MAAKQNLFDLYMEENKIHAKLVEAIKTSETKLAEMRAELKELLGIEVQQEKKKPGRKPGSTNKPKMDEKDEAAILAYVKASESGRSAQDISAHIGKELPQGWSHNLVESGLLVKTGEKRGAKYHAPVAADAAPVA